MKNFILIAFILFFSFQGFSQKMDRRERIKALKTAFITEKLELSKTEAEKFWPIYNTYQEQEHTIRNQYRDLFSNKDVAQLSENEADKAIKTLNDLDKSRLSLKENYMKDLKKVLSSKKILMLKIAEDEFNKKMFEEFKRRHNRDEDKGE